MTDQLYDQMDSCRLFDELSIFFTISPRFSDAAWFRGALFGGFTSAVIGEV